MPHLEKIVFLLMVLVGALLRLTLAKRGARLRRCLDADWVLYALVAVPIVGFLLVAGLRFLRVEPSQSDLLLLMNSPAFVRMLLGIISGFLLVDAIRADEGSSWRTVAALGLPFVAVFAIGFFALEIRTLYRSAASVQAAGVSISFREIADRDTALSPLVDAATLQTTLGKGTGTPFELGLQILGVSLDRAEGDYKKIVHWCTVTTMFQCEVNEVLRQELERTTRYIDSLKRYRECLTEYYEFYPNGLPIQDELSEIATDMYTDDPSLVNDLENLTVTLQRFDEYARNYKKEIGETWARACTFPESTVDDVISRREALDRALPYKSIIEAAVIAASGYSVEAGRHLERQLRIVCEEREGQSNAFRTFQEYDGFSEGDFIYFLFETRLLFALDVIHYHNRDHDRQVIVAKEFVNSIEQLFDVESEYDSMPFSSDGVFMDCSRGMFSRVPEGDLSSSDLKGINEFAGQTLLSYVQGYFRLFWAMALSESMIAFSADASSTTSRIGRVEANLLTAVAARMDEQFSDRIEHVRDCYKELCPTLITTAATRTTLLTKSNHSGSRRSQHTASYLPRRPTRLRSIQNSVGTSVRE